MDVIPFGSQAKSLVQYLAGDPNGARQTQRNFAQRGLIISQVNALRLLARGESTRAKETFKDGLQTVGFMADGIPLLGHAKACVHLLLDQPEQAKVALRSATRSTVVIASGALAGPVAVAAVAGVGAGIVMDSAYSVYDNKAVGSLALIHALACCEKKERGGCVVDLVAAVFSDGLGGVRGAKMTSNPGSGPASEAVRGAPEGSTATGPSAPTNTFFSRAAPDTIVTRAAPDGSFPTFCTVGPDGSINPVPVFGTGPNGLSIPMELPGRFLEASPPGTSSLPPGTVIVRPALDGSFPIFMMTADGPIPVPVSPNGLLSVPVPVPVPMPVPSAQIKGSINPQKEDMLEVGLHAADGKFEVKREGIPPGLLANPHYSNTPGQLRMHVDSSTPIPSPAVTFYCDGEETFSAMYDAIQMAKTFLVIVGWDVDPGFRFPNGRTLGEVLQEKAGAKDFLIVIIVWANPYSFLSNLKTHIDELQECFPNNECVTIIRQDKTTNFAGSHHQKIVCCDGGDAKDEPQLIAFVGGLDLTAGRLDSTAHEPTSHLSWHDVHARTTDCAAAGLFDEIMARLPDSLQCVIRELNERAPKEFHPPLANDCLTQILLREKIQSGYIKAIEDAKSEIYIESQYFIANRSAPSVPHALAQAICANPDLRVVIVIPLFPSDTKPVTELADGLDNVVQSQLKYQFLTMKSMYSEIANMYPHQNPMNRLRFFFLGSVGKRSPQEAMSAAPIYVHSKLMIVDRKQVLIGSANINRRSMQCIDSEVTLSVVERDGRTQVEHFYKRLAEEHCGSFPAADNELERFGVCADENIENYTTNPPKPLRGHILSYPIKWITDVGNAHLKGLPLPGFANVTAEGASRSPSNMIKLASKLHL